MDIVSFIERDSNNISIMVNGSVEKYQILRIIEFNSDRKIMSVIVLNL